MKSKIAAVLVFISLVASTGLTINTINTSSAAALTCAVLPESICGKANNKPPADGSLSSSNSAVLKILEWVIAILTGGIGVAAVAAFIYAGVMYSSADGKADQVKKAKDIIQNTVIGLVVFAIMALALEWLIPGGVF